MGKPQSHPTEAQGRILDGAMDTWKMGAITLIGLLSLGATPPDDPKDT